MSPWLSADACCVKHQALWSCSQEDCAASICDGCSSFPAFRPGPCAILELHAPCLCARAKQHLHPVLQVLDSLPPKPFEVLLY